jgi:predicted nucleic acid-binding protein
MRDLGEGPTALDTVSFIYLMEENADFLPLLEPIFVQADRGEREIVTSSLTLLEVLVIPYRAGDLFLAKRYETLLKWSRGVRLVEIDHDQLHAGAQLRALHRIRTPDALQLAAALSAGSRAFVTNDRELPEIQGLRILQLRDYLPA